MERSERTRRPVAPFGEPAIEIGGEDIGRALRALSDADLARLQALARLWSRGLPGGLGWADVLNEAIVRSLDGTRRWPAGVPLLAFLSGVMRSICDDHWRRVRRELGRRAPDACADDEMSAAVDPERALAAAQALGAIHRLFARDLVVLTIIAGLAEGLAASDIRRRYGLSALDYDTARKRMRRALLRCGLTWRTP
ncbi:MAG TPA: sigma-70 family RNA polymerase sigma factor [Vineibacter sp.]|nr:sigma-70 family RNA polymerase sigma factor [Vineibacter sp.]